jgi:Predicted signal transduction protein with a C-terminal ATPase domain
MAMHAHQAADPGAKGERFFLPDLCAVRMVFAVVVMGELLAFVLVLSASKDGEIWQNLSLTSLFVQWVALSSAALLCLTRPLLERLHEVWAILLTYGLLLMVTALISIAALQAASLRTAHCPWASADRRGALDVEFLLRNLGISAVVNAVVLRYFYVQHQWKRNLEIQTRARIEALQARIRPHFLFNSMNTIAAFTRSRPELAEQAVEDLADLFRVSLREAGGEVTLEEELSLARGYLRLEKLRLDDRLAVEWALEGVPAGLTLPTLTLQPLLENAIYHGIEPSPQGGVVRISGHRDKHGVVLEISNPVPPETSRPHRLGNAMALTNIRQRLELAYGSAGGLKVQESGGTYRVELRIPYKEG